MTTFTVALYDVSRLVLSTIVTRPAAQQQHRVSWVVWSKPLCSHSNLSWGWVGLWQLPSLCDYASDFLLIPRWKTWNEWFLCGPPTKLCQLSGAGSSDVSFTIMKIIFARRILFYLIISWKVQFQAINFKPIQLERHSNIKLCWIPSWSCSWAPSASRSSSWPATCSTGNCC